MADFTCPHCDHPEPHRIEKYCPKCDETLPHIRFSPNKASKDGLGSWCKQCRNAHNKTPEERKKLSAYMSGWQDRNREKVNATAGDAYYKLKERREADPELDAHVRKGIRAKSKRWRTRHPEDAQACTDAWRAANPEAVQAHGRARRVRKKNAPINDLTAAQWKAIKEHYGYRCVYCPPTCKACRQKTHKLTQEHLTPLSKQGPHTVSNVAPACRSCNSRRFTGPVLKPVQPLLLI